MDFLYHTTFCGCPWHGLYNFSRAILQKVQSLNHNKKRKIPVVGSEVLVSYWDTSITNYKWIWPISSYTCLARNKPTPFFNWNHPQFCLCYCETSGMAEASSPMLLCWWHSLGWWGGEWILNAWIKENNWLAYKDLLILNLGGQHTRWQLVYGDNQLLTWRDKSVTEDVWLSYTVTPAAALDLIWFSIRFDLKEGSNVLKAIDKGACTQK